MKRRRVYSASTPQAAQAAQAAVAAARGAGIDDADVALIARSDIELSDLPRGRVEATTDTLPAALRGAAGGGTVGLLAGLVAVAIPPLGVTIAGAGLLTAIGAAVGAWTSALVGSTVPNEVRRGFEQEIESGRILIVIDAEPEALPAAEAAVAATGARPLPFDQPSATT